MHSVVIVTTADKLGKTFLAVPLSLSVSVILWDLDNADFHAHAFNA